MLKYGCGKGVGPSVASSAFPFDSMACGTRLMSFAEFPLRNARSLVHNACMHAALKDE